MRLLHIDSSILGENSASRALSAQIVERFRATDPGLQVTYRDLANQPLSHMTPATLPTDHPLHQPSSEAEASQAVLEEFLAADIVVIGAPMYNFGIPSQLKAWIDRIAVPGKTFSYGPDGVAGLAGDKRVIVAIARGNVYSAPGETAAREHAESYLRSLLAFLGIMHPEFVLAEGLRLGPDEREKALASAGGAVAAIAL